MFDLDGTDNKGKLGANAILAVSMATCKVPGHNYTQCFCTGHPSTTCQHAWLPYAQYAVLHVSSSTLSCSTMHQELCLRTYMYSENPHIPFIVLFGVD